MSFLGWNVAGAAAKSHADERLQQTANHAIQFEIALHRDQTDAILRRVDHDLVIDGAVTEIEIAWPEMSAGMGKAPRQHAGHFESGVGVLDHFRARPRFQKKNPRRRSPSGN